MCVSVVCVRTCEDMIRYTEGLDRYDLAISYETDRKIKPRYESVCLGTDMSKLVISQRFVTEGYIYFFSLPNSSFLYHLFKPTSLTLLLFLQWGFYTQNFRTFYTMKASEISPSKTLTLCSLCDLFQNVFSQKYFSNTWLLHLNSVNQTVLRNSLFL